jgi:fructose-1,6-bisphosphatase-3
MTPVNGLHRSGFSLQDDSAGERMLMARMHKAITMIQFKLEAQIIRRRSEYRLADRLLLDKIDTAQGTIAIDKRIYPLRDKRFQTVDPQDPYALTPSEQHVVDRLKVAFLNSEKLQLHARFLFAKGSIYKTFNGNLLYHGCIPMNDDGSYKVTAPEPCRFRRKGFDGCIHSPGPTVFYH